MLLANWRNTAPSATIFSPSLTPLDSSVSVALLDAERHQPLRKFAGLDLHIHKRKIVVRAEDGGGRDGKHTAAGLGVDHRIHEQSFLSRPAGFLVTIRTGVVRVAGSSSEPM